MLDLENADNGLKEKNAFWGVLGEETKDTEYQLATGELDLPMPRKTYFADKIEYHQPEISPVSCTIHGAMGAVSDLTGYRFSVEERKAMWAEAKRLGAKEGWGWYVSKAVDLVRKYASARLKEELVSFVVEIDSDEYVDVLEKGYSVVTSFQGNKKYGEDKADGILTGKYFGKSSYGHCIRNTKSEQRDPFDWAVDNYLLTRAAKNRYQIPHDNIQDLVKNAVFSRRGYVFAYKKDVDLLAQDAQVPVWALKSVQKARKSGVLKPDDSLTEIVGSAKLEATLVSVGALSNAVGNLTMLRWIVALDRMGKL